MFKVCFITTFITGKMNMSSEDSDFHIVWQFSVDKSQDTCVHF